MMYKTSKRFLEYFGLVSLADLPGLKEFSEKEFGEGTDDIKYKKKQLTFPLESPVTKSDSTSRDSI